MILIDTKISSFDSYIESLSKKARKNWKFVKKWNGDLNYFQSVFIADEVERWMKLWERQEIRGKNVTWAFGKAYLEDAYSEGRLLCFAARKGEERIAMHFIEKRDGYWECHPPMYDKEKYSGRYLAKYMWFELIKWSIEKGDMGFLDFGGGGEPDWREMIIHRDKYPNPAYKWMYVPYKVKSNPNEQRRYTIENGKLGERV